jgi:hypothetical protein
MLILHGYSIRFGGAQFFDALTEVSHALPKPLFSLLLFQGGFAAFAVSIPELLTRPIQIPHGFPNRFLVHQSSSSQ